MQSAVTITRQWLDQGDIFTMKTRDGVKKEVANQTATSHSPLVILVDHGTSSGAEIVAAALQENGRAKLVGNRTFGHNVIGSVHTLQNGAGVIITIAKWVTPKQYDIGFKGLTPDVELELSPKSRVELSKNPQYIGTQADGKFAKAVEVLGEQIQDFRPPSSNR